MEEVSTVDLLLVGPGPMSTLANIDEFVSWP